MRVYNVSRAIAFAPVILSAPVVSRRTRGFVTVYVIKKQIERLFIKGPLG